MIAFDQKKWPIGCLVISAYPSLMAEVDIWCTEHIGKKYELWTPVSKWNGSMYHFKDNEAKLVFLLRWGNYVHNKESDI